MGVAAATGSEAQQTSVGRSSPRLAWLPPIVAALALAGCGQRELNVPPTAAISVTVESTETSASPQAPSPLATPDSTSVTFGGLADRITAAWADVRTYQAEFRSESPTRPSLPPTGTTDAATPVGPGADGLATPLAAAPFVARREVVMPDKQRQTLTGAGDDDHEAIIDGDTIYLRGPFAGALVPGTANTTWLSIPRSDLTPESDVSRVLSGLSAPPVSPLAGLREGLRPQELRELGPVEIEGRSCIAYGGADTTAIGTRQDITIAVDAAGLPCSIETRVGIDLVSQVVYSAFNQPLTIETPSAATPVASLSPAATPVGRD